MTTSPAAAMPVIDVSDLKVTLDSGAGAVEILRGVDFRVQAGETVGIVGPSGSGKSTLMAVLAGLEQASGGRVRVAGAELTKLGENALARHRRDHIGVVLQAFHLIPTMTALENVSVPLELAGEAHATERAVAELESVGLGHRLHHYPSQLSGGEQQRVAIARALVSDPDILFADEPTGNLDSATGHAVMDILFHLHEKRAATLILITHDPALAARCGRVIHIADGRIVTDDKGGAARLREVTRA